MDQSKVITKTEKSSGVVQHLVGIEAGKAWSQRFDIYLPPITSETDSGIVINSSVASIMTQLRSVLKSLSTVLTIAMFV